MSQFWKASNFFCESNFCNSQGKTRLNHEDYPNAENEVLPLCELSNFNQNDLPVSKYKNELLYLLEQNQVLVIVGQTGSGKTTQIPKIIYEAGWAANGSIIGCTQPRRVAVTSIATRVAEEMKVPLGLLVGYTIGFSNKTDPVATRIKYLTDAVLLQEILQDPLLTNYSVIMIDEVHEGSIYTEASIAILNRILRKRADLRIIVSSATLETDSMVSYFAKSDVKVGVLPIEGRAYPVEIFYLNEPCSDYVTASVETVHKIHKFLGPKNGDILVFLTGVMEINDAAELIMEKCSSQELKVASSQKQLKVVKLSGSSPLNEQIEALRPASENERKVILSTNVCETSVTIDGVYCVVDSGFVKLKVYSPNTNSESLVVVPICKSSAKQRAGRAGRQRPGKVYRLYTQESYNMLQERTLSEIQRSDLVTIIAKLKALGIENLYKFKFYSKPPACNVGKALEVCFSKFRLIEKMLYSLKAIDDNGSLTPLGTALAELNLNIFYSCALINSLKMMCAEEVLIIVSILSSGVSKNLYNLTSQQIFYTPHDQKNEAEEKRKQFYVEEGDHITYLNVFKAFLKADKSQKWCQKHFLNYQSLEYASQTLKQVRSSIKKHEIPLKSSSNPDTILRCLLTGCFANVAKMNFDGSYSTLSGISKLYIHPNSSLSRRSPKWVFYDKIVQTTKSYIRDVSVISESWLLEIAPNYYQLN